MAKTTWLIENFNKLKKPPAGKDVNGLYKKNE